MQVVTTKRKVQNEAAPSAASPRLRIEKSNAPKITAKSNSAKSNSFEVTSSVQNLQLRIATKHRDGRPLDAVERHLAKLAKSSTAFLSAQFLKSCIHDTLTPFVKTLIQPKVITTFLVIGFVGSQYLSPSFDESEGFSEEMLALAAPETAAFTEEPTTLPEPATELAATEPSISPAMFHTFLPSPKQGRVRQAQDLMPILPEILPEVTAQRPPKAVTAQPSQQEYKAGLVKFISGVISVYHPDISDCGELAKEIVDLSSSEQLDPLFITALISVESRFLDRARSHAGATGLMQLLPNTAREVVKKGRIKGRGSLTDVHTNIRVGISYLKELSKRYRGNKVYTLAAYNWGPGNVDMAARGQKRIPGSVTRYARTILQRAERWHKHFASARRGADSLAQEDHAPPSSVDVAEANIKRILG